MMDDEGQDLSGQSYYISLLGTKEYNRFWRDGHNQTKLGLAAFSGLALLQEKDPEKWDAEKVADLVGYINSSIFVKCVDNFQIYIVDLLSSIFVNNPKMIPAGQIEGRLAFEFDDVRDLRAHVVEQAATKYSYMNIVDLDEDLKKKFSFDVFENKLQRLRVRRLVEIRNIVVHNRSIINRVFIRKVGFKSDKLGQFVSVPSALMYDRYFNGLARQIDQRARGKFNLRSEVHG
jgi:hypothetical protein